ncbi:hypothetical protein IWQ57_005099 [Coemansia nantahalensis]|uniref:Uncharacterized protein n=2 Tax=Coemansia TaxID=4863 RepID=A0ACC1LBN1_9FUNG|nr:hypothetical protein IWQ57_005099 [Coemansia nantahalensis]KAJ2804684.1 hypothetical protein H4R21_001549 [Coemansia helicoidea]
MSGLQTELSGRNIFEKSRESLMDYPPYDVVRGREASKEEEHIAQLAEQFRADMRASVFYLQPPPPPPDIERYSDRYFKGRNKQASLKGLQTDIDLFPEELHPVLLKKRIRRTKAVIDDREGIMELLKNVRDDDDDAAGSGSDDGGDGTARKKAGSDDGKSGDDDDQNEALEEEEEEEDNDYMDSYFDNGEDEDIGDVDDDDGGGGDYS